MQTLANLNCPVEITSYKIDISQDGKDAILYINYNNLSDYEISALKIKVFLFNSFNEPVIQNRSNSVEVLLQDLNMKAEKSIIYRAQFVLNGFGKARIAYVIVASILHVNGQRWDYKEEDLFELNKVFVEGDDLKNLKALAGLDAICYARVEESYWQCVCGKANCFDINQCLLCNRNKTKMIKGFSNKVVVNSVAKKKIKNERELLERKRNRVLLIGGSIITLYLIASLWFSTIIIQRESIYIGEVYIFQPNGYGTSYFYNGDKYVGEFLNSDRHGFGAYYWTSGKIYEGSWYKDMKHGNGTLISSSGSRSVGIWEYDMKVIR
jgi:hypothetical protein